MIKITLLFLLLATPSFGQVTAPKEDTPATKLGTFIAKRGSVVLKDYYNAGEVPGLYGSSVKVEGTVLTSGTNTNERIKGLRLTATKGDNDNMAFLDMEDVASFSSALKYLSEQAVKMGSATREYSEVTYTGKDHFETGFYQEELKQVAYFAVNGYPKILVFFSGPSDLLKLKDVIDGAAAKLKDK